MATGASDPVATTASGTTMINAMLWGSQWSDGSGPRTTVNVYIAGDGETFDFGGTPVTAMTNAQEVTAFNLAMQMFENICNIDFVTVNAQNKADIIVGSTNNADAQDALGLAIPPGEDPGPVADQQGAVIVNHEAYYSLDFSSLLQGGYDFISFIHELGHAVGLKHPHDTGGGSFPEFPGVTAPFGDYGDFDFNQGIFTMMSYNDGNPAGPLGEQDPNVTPGYGWEGTPMAFDIAALQYLYGANMSYHTGNDVYVLPSANGSGTFFSCIWDAGGTDTIMAGGGTKCVINLNAATLKLEPGGGGFLSSHNGILGGFTIAHGAVIENATGGAGRDWLIGNGVDNVLVGRNGADALNGGLGADTLKGGFGADRFIFSKVVQSNTANGFDTILDFGIGADVIDLRRIDGDASGSTDQFHFIGASAFGHVAGELRAVVDTATHLTTILGDTDGNGIANIKIVLKGEFSLSDANFLL